MNLLLPFNVPSEDRKEIFSKEMEYATIFCLTEMARKKRGGLILKKPPEEIFFITEAYYPIWLVPWEKITLLFDGLDLNKHTLSLDLLPDINSFIKEKQTKTRRTDAYIDFLKQNINFFQNFAGKSEKTINGLLTDQAFLKDLTLYLSEGKRVRETPSDAMIISLLMDEERIETSVNDLSKLKSALKDDIKNLGNIVKMLIATTDKHMDLLTMENDKIKKRAEEEIAQFKSEALKKIEQMRKDYDQKILKISKDAEKEIQKMQEEIEEMEKREAQLTTYAKQCETEISNCQARKDEDGLEHWKAELQKCKEENSEIRKRISRVKADIKDAQESRDLEISRLKSEFNDQSEALMAGLKKIEDVRDDEVAKNEDHMKTLKDLTSTLITQINRLSDLKRLAIDELYTFGLPEVRKTKTIVYLPFYLACYKQEFKRRCVIFPPSIANTMSRTTKIKGAFTTSKVKIALENRSESIAKFLNIFLKFTKQNPIFEEKITAAAVKTNILRTKQTRDQIAKGLVNLRIEGWLSETEFKYFNEQLKV